MTTNREVYEGKILETLMQGRSPRSSSTTTETLCVCNNERLAVVEKDIKDIKEQYRDRFDRLDMKLNLILGSIVTVGLGVLAALYSEALLNALN